MAKTGKLNRSKSTSGQAEELEEAEAVQNDQEREVEEEVDVDEFVTRYAKLVKGQPKKGPVTQEQFVQSSRLVLVLTEGLDLEPLEDAVLPDFRNLKPLDACRTLGEIIGISDYETNLSSFWILDVLSETVRQSQLNGMKRKNQKMLIVWFIFILKYISVYNPTREEMFTVVDWMLLKAKALMVRKKRQIPHPKELHLEKKRTDESINQTGRVSQRKSIHSETLKSLSVVRSESFESLPSRAGIRIADLLYLADTIYKILANRFVYEVVRMAFTSPPEVIPIKVMEDIKLPKPYKAPEPKATEDLEEAESVKKGTKDKKGKKGEKDTKGKKKGDKGNGKGGPQLPEALTKPTQEDKLKAMLEDQKRKTKDHFILALSDSVDSKFYERLFPPNPEEVEKPAKENNEKSKKSAKKTKK